jgi:hypothetical protein
MKTTRAVFGIRAITTSILGRAFGSTNLLLLLWTLPSVAQAQFTYTTNQGTITMTGYTGKGGAVAIPATINGFPVNSIGICAFQGCTNITSITIPNSVLSIGELAFTACWGLTNVTIPASVAGIESGPFAGCVNLLGITVDAASTSYASVNGVLFDKSQTTLIQYPAGKAGSYSIPGSVGSVGGWAFDGGPDQRLFHGKRSVHRFESLLSSQRCNRLLPAGHDRLGRDVRRLPDRPMESAKRVQLHDQ